LRRSPLSRRSTSDGRRRQTAPSLRPRRRPKPKRSAPLVIVAGHITVEPRERESYVAGCVSVVEQARGAAGCLDFAITADLVDPGRVNIFERWESQAAVDAFRGSGPSDEQGAAMLSASVVEYDIADVRPLFGEGTA
jgi:quinol monooxygenase YgiN